MAGQYPWEEMLAQYSERDQQLLAQAAEAHADLVEEAALDLTSDGIVRGMNIQELWPFVLKRREQIVTEGLKKDEPEPVEEPEPAPKPRAKPGPKPKPKAEAEEK